MISAGGSFKWSGVGFEIRWARRRSSHVCPGRRGRAAFLGQSEVDTMQGQARTLLRGRAKSSMLFGGDWKRPRLVPAAFSSSRAAPGWARRDW